MQILIMDRGVHLDPDAVRRECPSMIIEVARNVVFPGALRNGRGPTGDGA